MGTSYLTKNMGTYDRALRAFVIAPVAIIAAFALGALSIGGIALFALAGLSLVTGASGRCPGYLPFGLDTRGGLPLLHH